jgi:hypothetical protein
MFCGIISLWQRRPHGMLLSKTLTEYGGEPDYLSLFITRGYSSASKTAANSHDEAYFRKPTTTTTTTTTNHKTM